MPPTMIIKSQYPFRIMATFFAIVAVSVTLLAGVGYAVLEQRKTTDRFCQTSNENRAMLRALLIDARNRTRTSKQRTLEEKAEAEEFYAVALAKIPTHPCS